MDWKEYLANTEVIIHAGGMSERWFPVTRGKLPKPLTDIGKTPRPIIDWVLLPYVVVGVKKFYISLWNNPEVIMNRCEQVHDKTGIGFKFLVEPPETRMGKAGVVKYHMALKILDRNKHKLNVNASDIVKIDVEDLTRFHLDGLTKKYLATITGSKTGQTQFDKLVFDKKTKGLKMLEKPPVILPPNEFANVGIAYFDAKLNSSFMKLKESEFPVDWEKSSISDNIFEVSQCFNIGELGSAWYPLKTPHDYKKIRNMDLEKWFGIKSIEQHLGYY